MKLLLVGALVFSSALAAVAQGGPVIVNVNGISCTNLSGKTGFEAQSFALGGAVSLITTPGNTLSKPPSLDALNVSKTFDQCSEPLIRLFLGSTVVPSVTLTQFGIGQLSNTALMTITLNNAMITAYQVEGGANIRTMEALAFTYRSVCVSSRGQNPDGSLAPPVTVCYDTATRRLS